MDRVCRHSQHAPQDPADSERRRAECEQHQTAQADRYHRALWPPSEIQSGLRVSVVQHMTSLCFAIRNTGLFVGQLTICCQRRDFSVYGPYDTLRLSRRAPGRTPGGVRETDRGRTAHGLQILPPATDAEPGDDAPDLHGDRRACRSRRLVSDAEAEGAGMSDHIDSMLAELETLSRAEKIAAINDIKRRLHEASPFKNEPVDCVLWEPVEKVTANDYNPNAVAPPEMKLLEVSITADGYTQPVVADLDEETGVFVVVDGFHRNRVARESDVVKERVGGYLPVVQIRDVQTGRPERIASTIRHNRARGKHQVEKMSEIVLELKRRNWSDKKIGKELGMEPDEVLRLAQITGLAEMFRDHDFSEAWEPAEGVIETAGCGEDVSLEWVNSPLPDDIPHGWNDRTERSSVLYGERPRVAGLVQKSNVMEKWHWYAYTQPMESGETATREEAKLCVEQTWAYALRGPS